MRTRVGHQPPDRRRDGRRDRGDERARARQYVLVHGHLPKPGGPSPRRQQVRRSALQGARLLVVDDNETNRVILADQLESWAAESTPAASAVEGLALLDTAHTAGRPYDVVLLDYLMPEVDGLEFARRVRRDDTHQGDPTAAAQLVARARPGGGEHRGHRPRHVQAGAVRSAGRGDHRSARCDADPRRRPPGDPVGRRCRDGLARGADGWSSAARRRQPRQPARG
ncbi:response regulator [Nostocoides sp. HKS02]|nr:response regulator [Tetrasphaera sp. HKS02]